MATCKKCENLGSILLRKKDLYCEECFISNVNHKFRACIGKNKILSGNENVLICLSEGPDSVVLLDLIYDGISLNNHKRLWITPKVLHIIEKGEKVSDDGVEKYLIEKCGHYNFDIHIARISEYVENKEENMNAENQFEALINSMPVSSQNDFMQKVKRNLFLNYAKKLNCNFIFTAETSGTLAINLLSSLCNGRGSQVQHDIGFCDSRAEIKILRPMRDISHEELQHYIRVKELVCNNFSCTESKNSLQNVIKNFVVDLQDNFQSTISTVCKTADKIGVNDGPKNDNKCLLCETAIGEQDQKFSALQATDYSKHVSIGNLQYKSNDSNDDHSNLSMFPHVNKLLCYTCSRHVSEMDHAKLPLQINQMLI